MTSVTGQSVVAALRGTFDGQVIAPGDPEYDSARTVFTGGFDRRPAVLVRPGVTAGVVEVVRQARESGLPLAVRSGGHSGAAHGVCDDGLVLDLRGMKGLQIDVEGRTAWAETGLTAGEFTTAVGEHGLAVGFGDTGSVGLGGVTLGGGVGFLARKYGLTVDDVLAAEVVTATGEVLHADAEHHPELFWAIRGGGGNFGVVTRFQFRLHELRTAVAGMLLVPASPDLLASFLELAEAAPDELTTIANVMSAPPMPFIPAEHHGKLVVMAQICYAGPAAEAEPVLAPFRALAAPLGGPLVDMVREVPYPQVYQSDEPEHGPTAVVHTMFVDSVDRDAAGQILDLLEASDAPMRAVQLRVLGGAVARVAPEATAYAHRASRVMANIAALYARPEERARRRAWVQKVAATIEQSDHGAYVNFFSADGPERTRAAYPGDTWDRLVRAKRRYDPDNLFRLNVNIPPDGHLG
jgi:FAD/FMN-containing dehydrogenase